MIAVAGRPALHDRSVEHVGAPAGRQVAPQDRAGRGADEKSATWARTRRATPATSGSSALSTTQPSGLVMRAITDLTSASSGSV